jgi:catechol 2,3-dioxygenase-like lactoylglutathione lyase family enzyme
MKGSRSRQGTGSRPQAPARPAPATPPPVLDGILESVLYVEDVGRSVAFYTELFGFYFVDADERLSALAVAPRQLLVLAKKGASAGRGNLPHDGDGHLHLAFAIPIAELGAWRERLRARGIRVENERKWRRGGRSLYFRDPDGHLLELATPGVWSVY